MTTKMIAAIRANGSIIPVAEVPEWVLDYAAYRREGGKLSPEDWLRENGLNEEADQVEASRGRS